VLRELKSSDWTRKLFQISAYLNAEAEEKLLEQQWLISAIPAKFNHLRGVDEAGRCRLAEYHSRKPIEIL
jgi:hypothetical protein